MQKEWRQRILPHCQADADDLASTWRIVHAAPSRLARERCAAEAEEGRWLLRALRSAAHVCLGFGSFSEYIERLFGYQPRSIREKLRVAEALEQPVDDDTALLEMAARAR